METSSLADDTFQCEHCDNKFKTENGLKIHIGKTHKSLKETLSPEKIRDNPLVTSLSVSPYTEEEEEVPNLPVSTTGSF